MFVSSQKGSANILIVRCVHLYIHKHQSVLYPQYTCMVLLESPPHYPPPTYVPPTSL